MGGGGGSIKFLEVRDYFFGEGAKTRFGGELPQTTLLWCVVVRWSHDRYLETPRTTASIY